MIRGRGQHIDRQPTKEVSTRKPMKNMKSHGQQSTASHKYVVCTCSSIPTITVPIAKVLLLQRQLLQCTPVSFAVLTTTVPM